MIWNGHLEIFRNFKVDTGLPKWTVLAKKTKSSNSKYGVYEYDEKEESDFAPMIGSTVKSMSRLVGSNSGVIIGGNNITSLYNEEKAFYAWAGMSWIQKLWSTLKNKFFPEKAIPINTRPSLSTVRQTFLKIAENAETLAVVAAENDSNIDAIGIMLLEMAAYSKLIEQARDNGQTALEEKMKDGCLLFLYEAVVSSCGFDRVVSEKMLVDFLTIHWDKVAVTPDDEEPDKVRYYSGFRLDWMKNFTRVLPPKVASKKALADALMIFDNYVVFHYDPEKASSAMTQAEEREAEEARRDPILFGVIKGSTRLYFIADWIDEYCDLTLQEVVDKLKAVDYKNEDFDLKTTEYRKKLGEVGQALVDAELVGLDEIKRLAKLWLI